MKYREQIQSASTSPQQLELIFQTACNENQVNEFTQDILACYQEAPDNLLYGAWYYRLHQTAIEKEPLRRGVAWRIAIPLSLLNGLVLWLLSDPRLVIPRSSPQIPVLLLIWAPVVVIFLMAFVALVSRQGARNLVLIGAGLVLITAYALSLSSRHDQYLILMAIHLPALAWIAFGVTLIGLRSLPEERFAFLIKSIEIVVIAGLYLLAGMVFGFITIGMFSASGIQMPDVIMRLIIAGGAGLIPVLAFASGYDPLSAPLAQEFRQGLGRLVALVPRLLLPLTLLILLIYLAIIPFSFMVPFQNREVLIVYNAMLFAVMALLVGATPIEPGELSSRLEQVLRQAIFFVAALAVLVSLYAFSATLYRTIQGGLTPNRLAVIGWNLVNLGLLVYLLIRQARTGKEGWIASLQQVFSAGCVVYAIWILFLVLATPWLFP
jgi:hypothetical protein